MMTTSVFRRAGSVALALSLASAPAWGAAKNAAPATTKAARGACERAKIGAHRAALLKEVTEHNELSATLAKPTEVPLLAALHKHHEQLSTSPDEVLAEKGGVRLTVRRNNAQLLVTEKGVERAATVADLEHLGITDRDALLLAVRHALVRALDGAGKHATDEALIARSEAAVNAAAKQVDTWYRSADVSLLKDYNNVVHRHTTGSNALELVSKGTKSGLFLNASNWQIMTDHRPATKGLFEEHGAHDDASFAKLIERAILHHAGLADETHDPATVEKARNLLRQRIAETAAIHRWVDSPHSHDDIVLLQNVMGQRNVGEVEILSEGKRRLVFTRDVHGRMWLQTGTGTQVSRTTFKDLLEFGITTPAELDDVLGRALLQFSPRKR